LPKNFVCSAIVALAAVSLASCSARQQAGAPYIAGSSAGRDSSSSNDLLYVAGNAESYVVAYPSGTVVGTIDRPSFADCSDSQGNVYMTGVGSIAEFAHGSTIPSATAYFSGTAYSCSADPTTSNLAAVIFCTSGCSDEVAIFTNPSAPPQTYTVSNMTQLLYCAYDNAGNLYVDGYNGAHFALAELPAGGSAFVPISVTQAINVPGQVQWDGQYLAVEDRFHPIVYQFAVSGSAATLISSTRMHPMGTRAQESWIGDGLIAVPTGPHAKRAIEIGIWNYPSGGKRIATLSGFIKKHRQINGVTFSFLPSR
jgi:hypothetical protein